MSESGSTDVRGLHELDCWRRFPKFPTRKEGTGMGKVGVIGNKKWYT